MLRKENNEYVLAKDNYEIRFTVSVPVNIETLDIHNSMIFIPNTKRTLDNDDPIIGEYLKYDLTSGKMIDKNFVNAFITSYKNISKEQAKSYLECYFSN